MPDLTGMRALVTGGGTGIGFGIAEQLLAAGADVTIVGRRAEVLDAAAERLRTGAPARDVRAFAADMCEDDQIQASVAAAARGANLDVFVANATSAGLGTMLEMGPEMWEAAVRLNIVGNAMAIKHAGRVMRDHGGGSFVAISSTSATKVQPWLSPYVATKHALDMMVRCAAVELAPHNIRVNSVQPGYTLSESMVSMTPPELARTLRRATPLGRAGEPREIGHVVAFLASREASWITGQVLGVDGGLNIPVMPSMAPMAVEVYGEDYVRTHPLPDLTALNDPDAS
jgi:NAD(P)-dependent dehydrogenase (short-subunit alcohol dehydrogenase family)